MTMTIILLNYSYQIFMEPTEGYLPQYDKTELAKLDVLLNMIHVPNIPNLSDLKPYLA